MRQIYQINGTELTIEFTGHVWVARVVGECIAVCQYKEHHVFDINCTVEMDAQRCHSDLALLDAYEWAIRGREDAARKVAGLITDDEMYRLYVDPCEVNA